MPSKKKNTKKSVSKNTKHTAKASANSSPMNSNHSVEYCGICRNKVKVSNITFVDLRVKNGTIRKRMIYLCENRGHEWGKFVSSKTKTNNTSISNKNSLMRGGAAGNVTKEWNQSHTGYTTELARHGRFGPQIPRAPIPIRKSVALEKAEREAQVYKKAKQKYNEAQLEYDSKRKANEEKEKAKYYADIQSEIEKLEKEKADTTRKIEAKKRAEVLKLKQEQIRKAQEEKAKLEEQLQAQLQESEKAINAAAAAAAAQNATKAAAQDDPKPEEPKEPEEEFDTISFVNPPPIPPIHSNPNESNA